MKSSKRIRYNPFRATKERYWGNKIDQQRLSLLIFVGSGTLVGTFMAFTGLLGDNYLAYRLVNLGVFLAVTGIGLLFLFNRLSLYTAVGLTMIATCLSLNGGMASFALPGPCFSDKRAMADISLALVLGVCAVHAYLRYTSTIVCVLTLAVYVVCIRFTTSTFLTSYFPFFIAIAASGLVLGYVMVHNVNQINDENISLQQESQRISHNMELTPEQFRALMELAAEETPDTARRQELLEILGTKARRRLFDRVREIMQMQHTQMDVLARVLPELTESERSICRLILRGKRMTEIGQLLNKSKGNVSCQRSHIRAKLGLQPDDDLRDALRARLQGVIGAEQELGDSSGRRC